MGGFSTTSVAESVPFESEPDRPNGFQSKNVQEAIEEALALAIANDRYTILSSYGGNANTGRFMEFYPGLDCDEAPLLFALSATNVVRIICSTTANNSNATIGFYNQNADPTYSTPLFTLDMNNTKSVIETGTVAIPLFLIPANGRLVVKVDSGSINKPHLQFLFSSAI